MSSEFNVGKVFIAFGIDASSFTEEMVLAEKQASRSAEGIKDKLASLGGSLGKLRTDAKQVREELANTGNFRVRGAEALDKLHETLSKVREAGSATDKTLDQLSLKFEETSRGARTYAQALDKIAADKSASQSVRDLARALSDEAKEANFSAAALEKRATAINRQLTRNSRSFGSTLRQAQKAEEPHAVPEQAAASALVRGAEGTLSIRAGERFLTSTLGLGPALQAIFPVVGGLAMIDIFTGLIDKTEEWYQKLKDFENQPKIIAAAFRDINKPIEIANDELDVTNEKLKNEIAKLEGRPENSLKLALEEARLAADHLGESLKKDFDQLQKLLQEHDVSKFQQLLGNASDNGQLKKELFGEDGYGGVKARAEDISDRASEKLSGLIDQANAAKTKPEKDAINKQANEIRTGARSELTNLFDEEIKSVTDRLASRQQLQQTYLRYQGGDERLRLAAIQQRQLTGIRPEYTLDQAPLMERDRSTLRFLRSERRSAVNQFEHVDLEEKKQKLQAGATTASIEAPFQNKINELGGELEKVQGSLAAIGQTETAKTLAKAFGEAQIEIVKLNDELAKHHQALTLDQQVELLTGYDELESAKAEEEFGKKFEQTTNSIGERIAALRTLAGAIGQGYEAQRNASIENQLAQEFAAEYRDPELKKKHQGQIDQRRSQLQQLGSEQLSTDTKTTLDQLGDQVKLENKLASVERDGAEAVRLAGLAQQRLNLERDKGKQKGDALADAEQKLSDAQARRRAQQATASLEQETAATNRITAAVPFGAEAVRNAQLQNRMTEIRRSTPAGPERDRQIQAATKASQAQHQQEIVTNAIQTGNAFKNQLESLNEQIGALEQLRATQGDSLEIAISLKNLEQQRIQVLSQQALVFGSARDGMRAFFSEMATGAESAAQQIHDTLGQAFNSLNDTLARLVSGQKVSWGNFFQSISANLAKMSLQNFESQIAAKLFPPASGGRQGSREGTGGGILRTIGSLFGGFRAKGGAVSSDQWHVIGEEGPEIFVPDTDGTILPNKKLRSLAAFNNTQTSSQIAGVSGPTPKQGWLAMLAGALGGAPLLKGAGRTASKRPELGGNANLTQDDLNNLGDFRNSELKQLSGKTKFDTAGLAMMGVGMGLGIISMILNRPKDHHHKAGHAYSIPSWSFGGYRAMGGNVDPGSAYMVGEQGPELWTPPSIGGTIVPNHELAGTGGGVTIYQDNRGSDPALIEQKTRQGMQAAHNSAVRTSFRSYQEYQKRTPPTGK